MAPLDQPRTHPFDEDQASVIERRYVGVVALARALAEASDWKQLVQAIGRAVEDDWAGGRSAPGVRIWILTADGFDEVARYPGAHDLAHTSLRELRRATEDAEPTESSSGGLLMRLEAGGMPFGLVEVDAPGTDRELLSHAATIISCRAGVVAGIGDVTLPPLFVEGAKDAQSLMAAFASEARRQLDHDRLSAYLLTAHGRAFERFAVAGSPLVPGEAVILPFEEVGFRHVIVNNRALLSHDLFKDPMFVRSEDLPIVREFRGQVCVPLRVSGRPVGVLNFVSRSPGFYDEGDIEIAQQIADQVACFFSNIYQQLRTRTQVSVEAAERERRRIARDLYQSMGQSIAKIEGLAEDLRARSTGTGAGQAEAAAQVAELARATIADARRALADMLPRELDAKTLEEGIRATLSSDTSDDGPSCSLRLEGSTAKLSNAVRVGAYRIVQEALSNARCHAHAGKVQVTLTCHRDLEIEVSDDGVGFDLERVIERGAVGLQAMDEGSRALGGTLGIDTAPGRGTTICFELFNAGDALPARGGPTQSTFGTPDPSANSLRILVVESHPLIRAGLVRLVEGIPATRVVGEAGTDGAALTQARATQPDVILLDADVVASGLTRLVETLRRQLPLASILVLAEYASANAAAIREAGASAVVRKQLSASELAEAVRAVASGDPVTSPPPVSPAAELLTSRELAVLTLVAAGRTNAEISAELYIATKTVERQIASVVAKLGATNRAHASAIGVSRRIIPFER